MIPITLAVEDTIGEAAIKVLLDSHTGRFSVDQVLKQRGVTYLRSRVASLNRAAHGGIVSILLVDLDSSDCAANLVRDWLPEGPHANLMFRVAIREVESWLLADSRGIAALLGIPEGRIPAQPESLQNPKECLVNLARRSRIREIRQTLVPAHDAIVAVGPGYNQVLTEFVRSSWSLDSARLRAPSLQKALDAIARLERRLG